jgi:hypothetical protein
LSLLPGNYAGSVFGFGIHIDRKFFHDGYGRRAFGIAMFD